MSNKTVFSDRVQVYLQGLDALQPFNNLVSTVRKYYIGSETTNMIINDHRIAPILAADEAMSGENVEKFPEVFNQPAYAEIRNASDIVEVDLYEATDDYEGSMILWLGVIRDGRLPIHYLPWYTFRLMEDDGIAFVAIVDD